MERTIQRNAYQLVGCRVREGDRPGAVAGDAPAAAGHEAADTSDRVAQGDGGSEYIGSLESRELGLAHVPEADCECSDESAVEDAAGAQCREGEDIAGVIDIVGDVDQEHHELSAGEGGERAVDTEVC